MKLIEKLTKLLQLDDEAKINVLPNMMFKTVVSYTTRPMRNYETDGKEHWFVDDGKVLSEIKAGNIVAYTEIGPYKYYVDAASIDDPLNNLYIIDPKGIKYLLYHYHGDRKFIIVYINTATRIRNKRAKSRPGYDKNIYEKRCQDENQQFIQFMNEFDRYFENPKVIDFVNINNNGDIRNSIDELKKVIISHANNNIMYLVVGKTCSGKDSICSELVEKGI